MYNIGCDDMAKQGYVVYTADQIKNRQKRLKKIRMTVLLLFLFLMFFFLVLSLAYNGGVFTVTLDPNFHTKTGISIYTDEVKREHVRRLYAEELKFMDNISIEWLPKNYKDFAGGDHNGDNYIGYTFYVENQGQENQRYWYAVYIDDVIKEVDEAIRIMIVRNDEVKVYAKENPITHAAEKGTIKFYRNDMPVLESRDNFNPGDVDKITIFIWIEGDDPECVNKLLGGEIKVHMEITEEHKEDGRIPRIGEDVIDNQDNNDNTNINVTTDDQNYNNNNNNNNVDDSQNNQSNADVEVAGDVVDEYYDESYNTIIEDGE